MPCRSEMCCRLSQAPTDSVHGDGAAVCASTSSSPRRGGLWGWRWSPGILSKTSLEQGRDREGKCYKSWLVMCNPSAIHWLELHIPLSIHAVPRSALSSPSLPPSPLLFGAGFLQTFSSVFLLAGQCRCLHNTEGPSCERCSPGFYGNPFVGHSDDCKPCPCPGRSPCTEVPGSGEVVCTHCPPGQRGEAGGGQVWWPRALPAQADPSPPFRLPQENAVSSAMTGFSGTPWGRGVPCIPVSPASVMGTWISMPWGTATPCPASVCAACTTRRASTARGVGRASTGMRWLPTPLGSVHVRTAPGAGAAPLGSTAAQVLLAEGGRGMLSGFRWIHQMDDPE